MWSQDKYIQAIKFAARAHGEQKMPGIKAPYVTHLSMVCMEVIAALSSDDNLNQDLAIQCALLHDTIEDTDITYENIKKTFSQAIADGVMALTKNVDLPKEDRLADTISRIKKQPKEIWIVKLADRIINLEPPPKEWSDEKIIRYHDSAKILYEELGSASHFLSKRFKKRLDNYPS